MEFIDRDFLNMPNIHFLAVKMHTFLKTLCLLFYFDFSVSFQSVP